MYKSLFAKTNNTMKEIRKDVNKQRDTTFKGCKTQHSKDVSCSHLIYRFNTILINPSPGYFSIQTDSETKGKGTRIAKKF